MPQAWQDAAGRSPRGSPRTAPWARPSRRTGWRAATRCRGPSSSGSTPIQMVGTPAATVTCSASMRSAMAGGDRSGPGITSVAPAATAGVGEAPGVGVEHRHDRQDDVALADAEAVGHHGAHRVQVRRAVASRRRPWGCRWCRSCSTSTRPGSRRSTSELDGLGGGQQRPRSRGPMPAGRRGSRRRPPSSITTMWRHGLEGADQGPQQPEQRAVDEDHLVLGVVDDVGELLGEQADVEGVQHPARCTGRRSTARGGGPCSRRTWPPGRPRRCRGRRARRRGAGCARPTRRRSCARCPWASP